MQADSSLDDDASTATIDRLRSLLTDTGGMLVPGHDVALRLVDGRAERVRLQEAQIAFFADSSGRAQDRSIR
ncbi:hypothetical protein ABMA10_01755 [Plantibacter sp. RU18]